jgi:hypothetical protein
LRWEVQHHLASWNPMKKTKQSGLSVGIIIQGRMGFVAFTSEKKTGK